MSVPMFTSSTVIVFTPLMGTVSSMAKVSIMKLTLSLTYKLRLARYLMPPAPKPLATTKVLKISIKRVVVIKTKVSVPVLVIMMFCYGCVKGGVCRVPGRNKRKCREGRFGGRCVGSVRRIRGLMKRGGLPSFATSVLPVVVPVILVFIGAF